MGFFDPFGMDTSVASQVSADKKAVSEDRDAVEAAKTEVLNVAESIPEDYSTLSADVSELKGDLFKNTMSINLSDLTSGKFIGNGSSNKYTFVDDSNSYYTPNPIDVSAYKTLRIQFSTFSDNWTRMCGFVDSAGIFIQRYNEGALSYNSKQINGKYEIELDVVSPYFVFSCSTVQTHVEIIGLNSNYCTSDEFGEVERFIGLQEAEYIVKNTHLLLRSNRLLSDVIPINKGDVIKASALSGYQTAILLGNLYDYMPVTGSNWSATGASYTSDGSYPFAIFNVKKNDNSNFSKDDYYACINGLQITKKEPTLDVQNFTKLTAYVAPNGSDSNKGTSRSTPFATIQKAVDVGAKTIFVKEGTYSQGVVLNGKDGVSILIDHYYDAYSAGTDEDNPKIVIDGANTIQDGVRSDYCTNCHFGNIEVKNTTGRGFLISKCDSVRFDDCIAHDIGIGKSGSIGGFMITDSNGDFYNCICYNIGTTTKGTGSYHYDGFNIHGVGTTNFINCSAWNCEDDGISQHDACYGLVDGGEWYNCGKGGIATPTHGAKANISNVYCHDNYAGIYAVNDSAVTDRGNLIFSNCVCKDNHTDMIVSDYYKVIAINCVYDTVSGANNITRFGIV